MVYRQVFTVGISLLAVFFAGCQVDKGPLGTQDNPIKLYFTPSVDAETITTNSVEFIRYLEKETGLYFETGIPTSYIAVVEALGSERADIAVMNSFGYLMAHEKYGARAKLTVIRYGRESYRGQILAHSESGIESIADIQGKDFAYTDPSSTSGYLFPKKILKENNVTPKNIIFAKKHDNVVTMIYQRQVDAGATYYSPPDEKGQIRDARARVQTIYPDVADKVKVIKLTDPIRNDPFVFRQGIPREITEKVLAAINKFLATAAGQEVFKAVYSVEGVVPTTDADYDGLRDMVDALEVKPQEMLEKKD